MFTYFVTTLPHYLAYFGTAIALSIMFLVGYVAVTPLKEFSLIGEGKTAPALSLVGAFLGFAIPLAIVTAHSVSIPDMAIWGVVALLIQLLVFFVVSRLFKDISTKLADDCTASGVFLGGMSTIVGILSAACMVP